MHSCQEKRLFARMSGKCLCLRYADARTRVPPWQVLSSCSSFLKSTSPVPHALQVPGIPGLLVRVPYLPAVWLRFLSAFFLLLLVYLGPNCSSSCGRGKLGNSLEIRRVRAAVCIVGKVSSLFSKIIENICCLVVG